MKSILLCFYVLLAKYIIPRRLVSLCIVHQCSELKIDRTASCLELVGRLRTND